MSGTKKSNFTAATTISDSATLDFVDSGNFKISYANFLSGLGATGSIVAVGSPSDTPVLNKQGTVNGIRNLKKGFGIGIDITSENSLEISTSFTFDNTGEQLVDDPTASPAVFRSLVAGDGMAITAAAGTLTFAASVPSSVIIVKTGTQLTGVIDSTKQYFLDGIIDMSGLGTITVPAAGISLVGDDFDISQLISSTASHIMFTGTGSVKARDIGLSVSGTSSSIYSLVGATGDEFLEITRVNYNNCISLGEISGFRQGLELETGRFGGNPSLTLSGNWDGYRISTSLIRSLDNAVATPLFKKGTALVFSARFVADVNCDLGTLAAFSDFDNANFSMSSGFKIIDALFRRNGAIDSDDATINTGADADSLVASWTGNNGIHNTFEGGRLDITASAATVLSGETIGVFLDVAGTYVASDLQHFDSPSNGQIRHLGIDPREYSFFTDITVDGTAGDILTLKVVKWDNSASGFVDIFSQTREVFNFTGANDAAFFIIKNTSILDENDYLKIQIANTTAARDVTAGVGDYFIVETR
jgi:hypothetical protein